MRVLVVEDEVRLAAAVKHGLEAEGFAVDVAHDGNDGFVMAESQHYDAIVLDILLPGMNGFRVCAELRAAGNWTPILMLTAKDGDTTRRRLSTRGPTTSCRSPSPTWCSWHVCARSSAVAGRRGHRSSKSGT